MQYTVMALVGRGGYYYIYKQVLQMLGTWQEQNIVFSIKQNQSIGYCKTVLPYFVLYCYNYIYLLCIKLLYYCTVHTSVIIYSAGTNKLWQYLGGRSALHQAALHYKYTTSHYKHTTPHYTTKTLHHTHIQHYSQHTTLYYTNAHKLPHQFLTTKYGYIMAQTGVSIVYW